MNYTDRVAKGAAELDRILPGWERKIDLERLQLDSGCDCILGQLSVDLVPNSVVPAPYGSVINRHCPYDDLQQQYLWGADRGFAYPSTQGELDIDAADEVWQDLTQAWKQLITQRLEAGE